MFEEYYWLGLSMIEGLGSIRINKLLTYFGDAFSIWKASKRELAAVSGIGSLAKKIVKQRENINIDSLINDLRNKKIGYITLLDKNYPEILKNIYDPPPVLFYKGHFKKSESCIAIVGSRRSTKYGRKIAEKLGYELAQRGITIISGMARGIDTHGHLGALKARGRTIAVLGSGLDYIYPSENRKLFTEIQEQGLVLSEYPPGVKPLPGNFPQRNRIISGLSMGVIVVEAASRSGSLITAELALEQGRDLFAVPGNIDRPRSKGTNNLIKKGAVPVTRVDDILNEIYLYQESGKGNNNQNQPTRTIYPDLNNEEKEIVDLFEKETEIYIDRIIELSGKNPGIVNTILLKLELKGIVSRGPGKKYSYMGLQNLLKPL